MGRIQIMLLLMGLAIALPVRAVAFNGTEDAMVLTTFVNLVKAQTYDRVCREGNVPAAFTGNKAALREDLIRRLSPGMKADVGEILDRMEQEAVERWVDAFSKENGCTGTDAGHAARVLDVMSRATPQELMRELSDFADNKGK